MAGGAEPRCVHIYQNSPEGAREASACHCDTPQGLQIPRGRKTQKVGGRELSREDWVSWSRATPLVGGPDRDGKIPTREPRPDMAPCL